MDRMKEYKQLIKELSSKTVVFAFGRFNPPTTGHELLVKAVKKLAQQRNADHAIYASRSQDSKKNPLSVDKKVKYLKLMFPRTTFVAASEEARTFIEAAKQLNKKYKNIVMVGGSDRVQEFKRLLNTYNGKEFHFDTIDVVSAGERDPDADDASGMSASKMRALATKGDYAEFKKGLPSTVRDIDGKRLMNDIREGMGLPVIKEQIVLVKDDLREQYFRGEIFNVGDIVESSGQQYTIAKRGSNHLLLKESTGKLVSKWIQDVQPIQEEITMNEELTNKTLKPTDKIKVARIISTMLGVENAETSSNPENLINSALRKVRTKALNPEALKILDKMLALATEVGIDYDSTLKPTKLKEGAIQPSGTDQIQVVGGEATPEAKKTGVKKGVLTFYNFQKENAAVGTTLVHSDEKDNDNLRRRKIKYHLGEQSKIPHVDMTSYGDEAGHENTAQHIATDPEHKKKEKKLALSFIQKMQGVSEATDPAKETAKANLMAKHAKEKESLADKQAREKEALKEDQLDEISSKLAGNYYGAATKKHIAKVGVKPNMYGRIERDMGKQRKVGIDRAMDRITGARKTNESLDNSVNVDNVNHAGGEPHEEKWEDAGICPEHGVKDCHHCASPVDMSDYNKDYDSEMDGLELSDEEINKMVDSMSDEEIMDDYDEDEVALIDDETGEELPPVPEEKAFDESALVEVLSRQERMRAKSRIRRTASKRERATKIALRRYSDTKTINKRARRLAIKLMKQRMLRGRDPAKISVGEKERIERTLEKRKAIIGRVAQRLTSRVRKVEKARMGHTKFTKGNANVGF